MKNRNSLGISLKIGPLFNRCCILREVFRSSSKGGARLLGEAVDLYSAADLLCQTNAKEFQQNFKFYEGGIYYRTVVFDYI